MTEKKKSITNKKPLVCIIIVNWNGGQTTMNCLESLIKLTKYPNYKIIVIDNGSSDGTLEKISSIKQIDLFKLNENIGYAPGMNLGWKYSIEKYNPDYICNMNNDIVTIQDFWLDLMVEELEKDPLRGLCGNKLLFPDGRVQLLFIERKPKWYEEKDNGQFDFVKEVKAVGGANMLIKRSVIDKIGALDEHFFYGPDDIDYCIRSTKAGFKIVYQGLSKSEHLASFSYLSAKKDFIYLHQSYGQMFFTFRHGKLVEKILMVIRQFFRAFVTRKHPFDKQSYSNTFFHKSFIKRINYFFGSFFKALKDYKFVKMERFNGKLVKI